MKKVESSSNLKKRKKLKKKESSKKIKNKVLMNELQVLEQELIFKHIKLYL